MAKITKKYCEGRKSPYQLSWSENGKRLSRFFYTEEAREEFIKASGYLDKLSFESLMALDTSTIGDISRIEAERGEITFREIWDFWKRNHKTRRIIKLWDACDEYIRDMRGKEKCVNEHIRHVRRILEVLVEEFGERLVDEITHEELEVWLNSLDFSPVTKKNYRSSICAAWSSHGNSPVKENNGVLFYAKTAQKSDASDWEQTKAYSSKGCYNNLFILFGEGGRIYDFSRSYGFNPNWYYSDDGWEIFKYGGRFLFWKFDPLDPKKTPYDGNRPYVKYASDNVSTIHFATTEDHPRGYDNSIYHGYVRAGKMFDSFGNEIAPLSKDRDLAPKPTDFTKVFAGDADNVAWVSDFHLDGAGNPVIVFSVQKNCGKLRHIRDHQALDMRYFYARWDGKKWFCAQKAFAGTALYDVECDYTGVVPPLLVNVKLGEYFCYLFEC